MNPVRTEKQGRIGIVTIARPERRNALNLQVKQQIVSSLCALAEDAEVAVIVLTGDGGCFVAGTDIAEMATMTPSDHLRLDTDRVFHVVRQSHKPVIAAVEGYALGGGCELALACDIIVAADSAKFALPEVKLAMLPGAGGTQRLPRAIGKAKAMDLCLSARVLSADEADRYGLVSRVVPDAQLLDEALALARSVAGHSLPALMAIKECVNRADETALAEGLRFERRELHARFASADAHEGMHAFLGKRKPDFNHR